MAFSEFVITDGTISIDFLSVNKHGTGVGITRYTPGRANLKGGGTWQDSPLARGRRMAHGTKSNINDAVEFRIAHNNHQVLISIQQNLDGLLEKAIAYWITDWQDEPVYIKARAAGELNPRYAIIYNAEFPNYPDPYTEPYMGNVKRFVMDGMILGLERGDWLDNPPGEVDDIAISHEKHVASSSVYIGNSYTIGLTAIYRYTETPSPAYSSNLINASLPFNLLDSAGVTAGDITTAIYFGSAYPFSSVVFNIGSAGNNLTITWEISNGVGGYTDVTHLGFHKRDETSNFSLTGLHIVQWEDTYNFQPQALSSFGTLYWARARLSAIGGSPSAPIEATVRPYTAKYPYVEIDSAQVPGDLSALASIRISTKGRANAEVIWPQSVFVGLRSLTRNGIDCSDFTAYINMRTADNPSGISIDLTGTTTHDNTTTSASYSGDSPTGYYLLYTGATGDVLDECFRVNFDSSIVRRYYGHFRLFCLCHAPGIAVSDTIQLRARVKFLNAYNEFIGEKKILTNADFDPGAVLPIDLGYIQFPPSSAVGINDPSVTISLVIDGKASNTQLVYFYELFLLPVDEWSGVATGTTLDDAGDYMMEMDSARYPKASRRALLRNPITANVQDAFGLVASQPPFLNANTDQRLWFLQRNVDAHYGSSAIVSVAINPRFHHLRSD